MGGSPASVLRAEGGWYAVLQIPRTRSEEEWALMLLRDHDVLVQPGFFFDFESEAFLVLSLLCEPRTFAEGVRRIFTAIPTR
jgi:aspartate/methionine/tyrosine aminotransferase